jgi:putative transposase
VHLIRNSLAFVSWKDRKAILPSIRAIYRSENADTALMRLAEFEDEWGKRYPAIGRIWRNVGSTSCRSSPSRRAFAR